MVFDAAWFHHHQRKLLWVLNAPLLGRVARRFMGIGHPTQIITLMPNSHTLAITPLHEYQSTFFTHPHYAKRLYRTLAPLWWLMHTWDLLVDPWLPRLSFGFATLLAYPAAGSNSPVDGVVTNSGSDDTWTAFRNGAGNGHSDTLNPTAYISYTAGVSDDTCASIWRSIFCFNATALPSTFLITAATLSLYGSAKADTDGGTPNIDIYLATPAATNTLANGDFAQIGTTSQTGAPISYASWSTTGYNVFTLNATGRGNISRTVITCFGARNASYDVANVDPPLNGSQGASLSGYFADEAGTTKDPLLTVTWVHTLTVAGATTPTGAALKVPKKVFAGATTPTSTLLNTKVFFLVVGGVIGLAGTVVKVVKKLFSGGTTPTGALANVGKIPTALRVSDVSVTTTTLSLTTVTTVTIGDAAA